MSERHAPATGDGAMATAAGPLSGGTSAAAGRTCPFCGTPTPDRLCPGCGRDPTAARRPCPACGRMVPSMDKVCWHCGHRAKSDLCWKIPLIIALFAAAFAAGVLLNL